ncbi:IclR family transcriptional regulator [Ideonella sp. DXS22W]|uniref:IclR family transcriptional regulator n=1 Tax=Pseudaquabacterium inlustre TaxID=2984192 RepID=A0ABU9CGA9_9BURK
MPRRRTDPPATPPALPAPPDRRQRVQAASTGVEVLKGLADLDGRASLSALAVHLGEAPAKLHRYLGSLVDAGLVAQDSATQHYALGAEAIRIGLAAMRQVDAVRLAEPALARLRAALGLTAFVAVMGNHGPTVLRLDEPGLPVTVNVRPGSVLSLLWSATGRVFLATRAEGEGPLAAEALAEWRAATPAQRAELPARGDIDTLCATVRQQGLATVHDSYLRGISAVAAPLIDHSGRTVAVITVLGASGAFDASAGGPAAGLLRDEARALSTQMGATA